MSPTLRFLFLLVAFVCFIAAAVGVRAQWAARVNLIALGLALYIFTLLVDAFPGLG